MSFLLRSFISTVVNILLVKQGEWTRLIVALPKRCEGYFNLQPLTLYVHKEKINDILASQGVL